MQCREITTSRLTDGCNLATCGRPQREADQRVSDRPFRRPCHKPLAPLRPLRPLASYSARLGPIGPMAAPRDPIDLGAPICPMDPEGGQ